MNIAIIPARGGSKGIPNKNLKKVGGFSLVSRSIRTCIKSKKFSEIFISTDSEEIAKEAKRYGAKVIDRPASLSEDNTSTDPVIEHAIKSIEGEGIKFDYISLIQVTYPFLTIDHIHQVINGLKPPYDCAFACSEFHGFVWEKSEDKFKLANRSHKFNIRPRRQDQTNQLLELGSIYTIKKDAFKKTQSRFGSNPIAIPILDALPIEIDTTNDLQICRSLVEHDTNILLSKIMKNIKFIITDFDGVLTDNKVFTDSNGVESVCCNKADSLAIGIIQNKYNIDIQILTSEKSSTHTYRAKKIGIDINVAKGKKSEIIKNLISSKNHTKESTLYIGNDLNDIDAFCYVKYVFCPIDAHEHVKSKVDIILNKKGGEGIFRDLLMALENI